MYTQSNQIFVTRNLFCDQTKTFFRQPLVDCREVVFKEVVQLGQVPIELADLVIENLALRQQVTALKKERPRPPLEDVDRAFWVALRQSWPAWASRLVIVKAGTVAEWNRVRFRRYWARISQRRHPGRPRVDA